MQITLNGQARAIESGTTIAALIGQLELGTKFVAVELNLNVVPKAEHAETVLSDGDRLEIVTLVGGG